MREKSPMLTIKSSHYAGAIKSGSSYKSTSKRVGVIAVKKKGTSDEDYNPLVLDWIVSRYRKDKRTGAIAPVIKDPYCEDLFNSMFKKWREDGAAETIEATTKRPRKKKSKV